MLVTDTRRIVILEDVVQDQSQHRGASLFQHAGRPSEGARTGHTNPSHEKRRLRVSGERHGVCADRYGWGLDEDDVRDRGCPVENAAERGGGEQIHAGRLGGTGWEDDQVRQRRFHQSLLERCVALQHIGETSAVSPDAQQGRQASTMKVC
jgi:hypothetical protein